MKDVTNFCNNVYIALKNDRMLINRESELLQKTKKREEFVEFEFFRMMLIGVHVFLFSYFPASFSFKIVKFFTADTDNIH